MNPSLIIQVIQAIIASAPQVAEGLVAAKQFIDALFGAKLISKTEQDALHAYADGAQAAVLSGIFPPHWKVDPDPA